MISQTRFAGRNSLLWLVLEAIRLAAWGARSSRGISDWLTSTFPSGIGEIFMSTHWGMSPEVNALISVIAQIKLPLLISFAVGVFIAVLAFFVLRPLIMSMTRNEANRVLMGFAESDREGRRFLDPSHPVALLRARHEGPCRRAADKGDELASFHSTDLHLVTCQPGLGLQDIGRPGISQRVWKAIVHALLVISPSEVLSVDGERHRHNSAQFSYWLEGVCRSAISWLASRFHLQPGHEQNRKKANDH
jgi:hypothetical protein